MSSFVILTFCIATALTIALSQEEPQCSRFHYEEQLLSKLLKMEMEMDKLKTKFTELLTEREEHASENEDRYVKAEKLLEAFGDTLGQLVNKQSLSHYVRWGREDCPGNGTDTLYSGYMAGNHYNSHGGGVTSLCLPFTPTWGEHIDGYHNGAVIFGTEIQIGANSNKLFQEHVHNYDLSCASCTSTRASVIMMPGHSKCIPGWTEEYQGYLVASHPGWKGSSDFVCLDANFLKRQARGNDEHIITVVEAKCGILKCPPYVEGREIACVICTK